MSIEKKILKLEQHLLGRSGLPRWATDAAEDLRKTRELYRPNHEAREKERMQADPNYIPAPPEPPLDVDTYAADLVKRHVTFENYSNRFSRDHEEGRAAWAISDAFFERIKREESA
jgi:hypothetical protein